MTRKMLGIAAAAALLATSGCVLHVGGDGDYGGDHYNKIERQESRNRAAISRLELGAGFDAVRAQLGEPDFTEAYRSDGREIRILRYRTHRTHSDGDTTPDETTPLVFRDGMLAGIGERAVAEYGRAD